ncbi:MAG: UdgX family uracil-DNA binding protein [Polyangiaceae bacterium]|nr:UdgX family uracil-DNA binding protein [Polyangiaceae bacterium]
MIPERPTPQNLAAAAQGCTACDLYKNATQAVFGEGAVGAEVMLIGEQPGDQEDREGHPFVGPAGRLLDSILEEVGIERSAVYITNAVKHFKWEPRGKRRLHKKPAYGEIRACRPWLDAELDLIKPRVVVCLGATAAQSFMGQTFKITQSRGKFYEIEGKFNLIATLHPSAVLRMPSPEDRARARAELAQDLSRVRDFLAKAPARAG